MFTLTALAIFLYTQGFVNAWGLILGSFGGHICTPDLDQHQVRSYEEKRMYQINWLLGWVWESFWHTYGFVLKHRSWLSHAPVVGTLIRIAYLFSPLSIVAFATG